MQKLTGELIRKTRKELKMTIAEFAKELKYTTVQLGRVEKGEVKISDKFQFQFLNYLDRTQNPLLAEPLKLSEVDLQVLIKEIQKRAVDMGVQITLTMN